MGGWKKRLHSCSCCRTKAHACSSLMHGYDFFFSKLPSAVKQSVFNRYFCCRFVVYTKYLERKASSNSVDIKMVKLISFVCTDMFANTKVSYLSNLCAKHSSANLEANFSVIRRHNRQLDKFRRTCHISCTVNSCYCHLWLPEGDSYSFSFLATP